MLWVCAEVSVKFVTEISCFWCTDCRKAVKDILCLYIGTLNHHGRYQNLKVTYFQCSVVFSVRCCRFVKGFITTFVLFPLASFGPVFVIAVHPNPDHIVQAFLWALTRYARVGGITRPTHTRTRRYGVWPDPCLSL